MTPHSRTPTQTSQRRLAGKVAVITGASGGIGHAIASRFADEGATLVLAGHQRDDGEALATELRATGADAEFVCGDLRNDRAVDELAERVRTRHGQIDALVLNAGIIAFGATCDISRAEFDDMIAINVRAPWMCVRAMHDLLTDGAAVVATASVSSFVVFPGEGVYCMTKAAVIQLVRALALELAHRRIRVNALCPGIVAEAGMSHNALMASADPVAEQAHNDELTPLGRSASLAEIAEGAAYLASDDSSFMTGSSLVIDGGLTIPRV